MIIYVYIIYIYMIIIDVWFMVIYPMFEFLPWVKSQSDPISALMTISHEYTIQLLIMANMGCRVKIQDPWDQGTFGNVCSGRLSNIGSTGIVPQTHMEVKPELGVPPTFIHL